MVDACMHANTNLKLDDTFYYVFCIEIVAVDHVASLYQELKFLSDELSEEQQPTTQLSAITQKVASCRDRCYVAFNHLGVEMRQYERKIESLQSEIQALGRNPTITGKHVYVAVVYTPIVINSLILQLIRLTTSSQYLH